MTRVPAAAGTSRARGAASGVVLRGGTRDRIEAAATQLFFRRGYASTSMREIAQACELTVGALYNHFASKDAILVAIVGRVHADLEEMLVEALDAGADDPVAQLRELTRAHALFHTRYRLEARVANAEIGSLPAAERERIIGLRRRMRAMFADVIAAGVRGRRFKPGDVAVTTMAILNMGIRIAEWFRPDGRLSAEEVAHEHASLALRMVKGD